MKKLIKFSNATLCRLPKTETTNKVLIVLAILFPTVWHCQIMNFFNIRMELLNTQRQKIAQDYFRYNSKALIVAGGQNNY